MIKSRIKFSDVLIKIILYTYSLLVLFPVIWIIYTSLKTNQEFFANPWGLFKVPQFQNYITAWVEVRFSNYAINSILITFSSVILGTLLACLAAYVLARFKFKFSRLLFLMFIAGLYIPIVLVLPAEYLNLRSWGLYDSRIGLILIYSVFSLPYSILVMYGFFKGLQKELEEAAYVDGYGYSAVFWRIAMPLSKNGIMVTMLFNFLWVWNDFMLAVTFISSDTKRTLPVGLLTMMASFRLELDYVSLFAGINLIMIPTIIVYIIFQKNLQQGLTVGSVKG